jgi:ferredoxin
VRADAPYACRGGVCGTCRARCTVGAVSLAVNWARDAGGSAGVPVARRDRCGAPHPY